MHFTTIRLGGPGHTLPVSYRDDTPHCGHASPFDTSSGCWTFSSFASHARLRSRFQSSSDLKA